MDGRPRRVEAGARDAVADPSRAEEGEIADPDEPGGLPDRLLGGLHGERVAAAAAEPVEDDAPRCVRGEQLVDVPGSDAAVVEPMRKHDDVAREPVAADVARLPDAVEPGALAEGVVERASVSRAAAVALPVRADEEERPLDRRAGRAGCECGREVEATQILLMLDLEL